MSVMRVGSGGCGGSKVFRGERLGAKAGRGSCGLDGEVEGFKERFWGGGPFRYASGKWRGKGRRFLDTYIYPRRCCCRVIYRQGK